VVFSPPGKELAEAGRGAVGVAKRPASADVVFLTLPSGHQGRSIPCKEKYLAKLKEDRDRLHS
jgi:hypothetical protein